MLKTQEQENNEDGDEDGGDSNHGNDDDGESISHKGTNGNVDDIVGGESTTKAVGKTSGGNDDGDGAKAVENVDNVRTTRTIRTATCIPPALRSLQDPGGIATDSVKPRRPTSVLSSWQQARYLVHADVRNSNDVCDVCRQRRKK